jgi:hypothetical protein
MAKIKGIWRCGHCGNLEDSEREVICWECGKGEMNYLSREDLNSSFTQTTVSAARQLSKPTLVK